MKKAVGWIAFMVFVGLLVGGALNRTWDRTTQTAEDRGSGRNQAAQAEGVGEWLTVQGAVVSIDDAAMVVETTDGTTVLVEGQPWQYVVGQQLEATPGDQVTLTGFYEDGEFKTWQIEDATNGQSVTLRDESGRPGWAGQGRRQQGAGQDG